LNVINLADRAENRRGPALADFKPKVGGDETSRPPRFRISRSVVIVGVIGAHVIAGALFAIPVIRRAILEPAPAEQAGPPVAMMDMTIAEQRMDADKVTKGAKTRPPVLARQAGIVLTKPATALVLVRVAHTGKPDDVAVVESSGDARLDQVAIEFARGLEWAPALVAGRESTMSIRLPVEFHPGG
jgi:TonB family protein